MTVTSEGAELPLQALARVPLAAEGTVVLRPTKSSDPGQHGGLLNKAADRDMPSEEAQPLRSCPLANLAAGWSRSGR